MKKNTRGHGLNRISVLFSFRVLNKGYLKIHKAYHLVTYAIEQVTRYDYPLGLANDRSGGVRVKNISEKFMI